MFHIKQERRLDYFCGTPESPQEHRSKSRGTPKSLPHLERASCTSYDLKIRADPLLHIEKNAYFPLAPQEEASLSYSYVRGTLSLLLNWNGHRDALTRNKARLPCSDLNAGSSFTSHDEGMSESPVETLENALGLRLIWTGGLTSL